MVGTKEYRQTGFIKSSEVAEAGEMIVVPMGEGGYHTGEYGRQLVIPVQHNGVDRKLTINKGNCDAIDKALGSDDTKSWVGKKFKLFTVKTKVKGEVKDCINIEVIKEQIKEEVVNGASV